MDKFLTMGLQRSPDLQAILDYIEQVAVRAYVRNRIDDPDLTRLFGQLAVLKPDEMMSHDMEGSTMVLEPGDGLLDLVAKLRATERVIYAQR